MSTVTVFVETGEGERGRSRNDNIIATRQSVRDLIDRFQRLNPGVVVSIRFLEGASLVRAVRTRHALGLGPDLILTRMRTTYDLQHAGLTHPIALDAGRLADIDPRYLTGFRGNGSLRGVPILLSPEVACYRREKITEPPRNMDDLVVMAARGIRVGLPLRLRDLVWTASGTGAQDVLLRAFRKVDALGDTPRTKEQTDALLAWMEWLQRINLQKNITFVDTTSDLDAMFEKGEVDWIPCRDVSIRDHLRRLGPGLGVSTLPGPSVTAGSRGAATPATSITDILVASFGTHSSPSQRDIARRLTIYLLGRFVQRQMLFSSESFLPINSRVLIPVNSSALFQSLMDSLDASVILSPELPGPSPSISEAVDRHLQAVVVGSQTPSEQLADFDAFVKRLNR